MGSQVNTTPGRVQNVPARKSGSSRFYCVVEGESLRQTKVSDSVKSPIIVWKSKSAFRPPLWWVINGIELGIVSYENCS